MRLGACTYFVLLIPEDLINNGIIWTVLVPFDSSKQGDKRGKSISKHRISLIHRLRLRVSPWLTQKKYRRLQTRLKRRRWRQQQAFIEQLPSSLERRW
jgi:hypothetical protein